uniref:Hemerythrin n=1 Tax=Lumbrinerides crassicephala TaxID=3266300 RepID=A0A286RT79_9ANNE|nr:hemerythrin [Lumbrineris crassicephala]
MSEKIPEPFVWDESFKVFYDNLDDEHKNLFKAVFNVAADKGNAGALKNLVDVTAHHFSDEEGMMQKSGHDNYPAHKKIHDEFLTKIKGLKSPVDDGTIHFAKDWLVNHIKGIDFKYKGKL